MANRASEPKIPAELTNIATTVSGLDDKVSKCYSTERYEEFQSAVETIALKVLDAGNGREKIKNHAKEATKEYMDINGWEKFKVWVPMIVAVAAVIVSVVAIYKKP